LGANRNCDDGFRLRNRAIRLVPEIAAPLATQQTSAPHGGAFANAAGLAFIVLGIAIIVIAGWRFVQTAKGIDSASEVASPGERFDLALSGMVGLLGAALFLYLSHAVLPFI
jgi:hypothetical protein